jgi:GT2 family glycosyltransferase
MKTKKGLVSVLIVNWNEKNFLKDCFHSLDIQKYKNIEIIVVDNASSDGSIALLRRYAKRKKITLIESDKNLGFARGNNLAYTKATGEYILLLNADTKFGDNLISGLVNFLKKNRKAGVLQPKLVFMSNNNKLDNIGAYLTRSGIPYYFGLYKNAKSPKYNKKMRLYSAKGACMIIKKEVIDKTDFLDEKMFAYYEESDFCHRAWLAGYECWYLPTITVQHYVGATYKSRDNIRMVFMSNRNRIRSFLKNFELSTLICLMPVHFLSLILFSLLELFRGNIRKSVNILKAIGENIYLLPDTARERARIQNKVRRVSDAAIERYIFKYPKISYYIHVGGDLANYQD